MVSIVTGRDAAYPSGEWNFSPAERYPEYAFDELAAQPNPAYRMVREALRHAGLDAAHYGTAAWNPVGDWVPSGGRVFVLCNFVYHRRPGESEADFHSKCTHGSVVRAVVDYALRAVGPSGHVSFGNAPLQSCDWARVLHDTGADRVAAFYRERSQPVDARDLRLRVAHRDALGRVVSTDLRDGSAAVEVDLGRNSLLAEIAAAGDVPRFRVSDYDPKRTDAFHRGGSHRYVLHRDVLDADLVISVPKLKTHEKVGITVALKGFVGAVAHKDCLAHHRFGPPSRGGDEYPDRFSFLYPLSGFHDWVHGRPPRTRLQGLLETADRAARSAMRRLGVTTAGAWHGNETCWRMTLDLARILHFVDREGRMGDGLRRRHAAVVDGIVGGEGNGPLDPSPFESRLIAVGESAVAVDRACAMLMGFDPARIPLLSRAAALAPWPLPDGAELPAFTLDGLPSTPDDLARLLPRRFRPSDGWRARLDAA